MNAKLKKVLTTALLIAVMIVALHFTFPPLYAMGWHVIHGRTIQCGSVNISVPASWWASAGADAGADPACMLFTESTWFHWRSREATISFHTRPNTPDPADANVRANTIATLADHGLKVDSIRTGDISGTPTVCYEARTKDAPANSRARQILCNMHNRFVVHYDSDGLDRTNDFYDVLHSVR